MGFFGVLGNSELSYDSFEKWIDDSLSTELPEEIEAFCFNLYEDGENEWSVEIVGTNSFDKNDPDWACNEIFDNRDNLLGWESEDSYEDVLMTVKSLLKSYLRNGKYQALLKSKKGIGIGFVDGDLELL
jgi:hypothetical protein